MPTNPPFSTPSRQDDDHPLNYMTAWLLWDMQQNGGGGGGGTPGGSTGEPQYNNSGVFGGIPNGNAGEVLTSNGAGVPPSMQPAPSGGSSNVFVSASAMIPRVTNGAAVNSSETTTNDVNYDTLDFDPTTSEGAQFWLTLPNNWNAGTVTFTPFWTADGGAGTAIFTLAGRSFANDDALDTAFGTLQSSTDTLIAAGDMHIGPASAAITIAGTPANGVPVCFQVTRDVADTLNADARLIGIQISYTAS